MCVCVCVCARVYVYLLLGYAYEIQITICEETLFIVQGICYIGIWHLHIAYDVFSLMGMQILSEEVQCHKDMKTRIRIHEPEALLCRQSGSSSHRSHTQSCANSQAQHTRSSSRHLTTCTAAAAVGSHPTRSEAGSQKVILL